ncbi:C4-type zinc ribbon domain-containing protein [soil metagenome]
MKADPFAQLKLLDVQALDSRLLRLRHQATHLPELAEIDRIQAARTATAGRAADAQIKVDDLTVAQKKADQDVEAVKLRSDRDHQRIDSGAIANPKDLAAMQRELVTLANRIGVLEDEELEVMEALEEATGTLAGLTAELAGFDTQLDALKAARDEKLAAISVEVAMVEAERGLLVVDLPDDLTALYDKLRGQYGGLGAAELRARACGGCMLALDSAELSAIRTKSSDEVVRCENCSRILVRTSESGL